MQGWIDQVFYFTEASSLNGHINLRKISKKWKVAHESVLTQVKVAHKSVATQAKVAHKSVTTHAKAAY